MKNKKIVLAFSGGLDTTFCAVYLKEEFTYDVYSVVVNTGGFSEADLRKIEKAAKQSGVKEHHVINATAAFYDQCLRFLIYGNVLRGGNYPLSVSSERVFQAKAIAEYAKKIKADAIAHGSTGAGNDQVRFDYVFQVVCPEMEIITPVRDLKLSREQETVYLQEHGFHAQWEKAKYSINQGLWGTTIGGAETLTSHLPLPDEAYLNQSVLEEEQIIQLHFQKGEISGLNELPVKPVKAIKQLNETGSAYGIGRDVHVGETIIGIKGRVGFEAPAAHLIIKAHQLLEKHTLGKWQQYWKNQLAEWYGMLMHEAQFQDPVMRNIELFLEDTQKTVNGTVILKLFPFGFETVGVKSKNDLMNDAFGKYGEEQKQWTGNDVKGFTKILSNANKIFQKVNHE